MKPVKFILAILLSITVVACGGGGGAAAGAGGGGNPTPPIATKGVVYPVVVGLSYQTNSASGVVASDGSYTYKGSESVTFSAGGLALSTVPAAAQVTPLPLNSDVASTNLLRLLKALDTDGNLSNGITLTPVATSSLLSIDLTSESSVVAALASLVPSAALPVTSDVQVAAVLASTKTTALKNMGTYGSTYNTIILTPAGGLTPQAYYPKNAIVSLTSQPDWNTGSISGTATLTLNDNSQVIFTFNSVTGTYTALGKTQTYQIQQDWTAKSRIIKLYYGDSSCSSTSVCGGLTLRDNSQPNKPPVPIVIGNGSTETIGAPRVINFISITSGAGSIVEGSHDTDGIVVSQTWLSSKGKTGTGNTFSESFFYNETGSVTVTVTDDEGATASQTWQNKSGTASGSSSLTLAGSINSSLAMNNFTSMNTGPTPWLNTSFGLYNGTLSPAYPSLNQYSRWWTTGATNVATPAATDTVFSIDVYVDTANAIKMIDVVGGNGSTRYHIGSVGGACLFSVAPSCASVGISLNRTAGTVSFANTPMIMVNGIATSGSFTLNGTMSFTPF